MKSLYSALTDKGVLAIQVGASPLLIDPPMTHWRNDEHLTLLENLEKVQFESIVDYSDVHSKFGTPWSFLAVFKTLDKSTLWFSNEAQVNLAVQERAAETIDGESPFRLFDGATMMTYKYPDRISEELWCRRNEGQCGTSKQSLDSHAIYEPYESRRRSIPACEQNVALGTGKENIVKELCAHSFEAPKQAAQ